MNRMQTALAALAALIMALSAALTGAAGAQSAQDTAQHAVLGAMDEALAGPERPVWTRAVGESGDGDTVDAAVAAQPPAADRATGGWAAPSVVAGVRHETTQSPPARGPPTRGT